MTTVIFDEAGNDFPNNYTENKKQIKYKGYDINCGINQNNEVVYWCWNCKCYNPKNKMSTKEICKRCFKPTIKFINLNLDSLKNNTDETSKAWVDFMEEKTKSLYRERRKWVEGHITFYRNKKGKLNYGLIKSMEIYLHKKLDLETHRTNERKKGSLCKKTGDEI